MIEKKWKPKEYRTVVAYGPYPKGFVFAPTGLYRDQLLANRLIEPVEPEKQARPILHKVGKRKH